MKYNLSLCACIKNEGPYLAEWLEFHILQGVEHFFLYDNQSTDNTWGILKPYIEHGWVDLVVTNKQPLQMWAYADCLKNYGYLTKWLGVIDLDEFLFSPLMTLPEALSDFDQCSAVATHWLIFGSNGHITKPDGLVIENYTKRARFPDQHVKSIVQPAETVSPGNDPHTFRVKGHIVDENGLYLSTEYALSPKGTANKLRVHHYQTKSKAEAEERWKLPRSDTGTMRDFESMFKAHDVNELEDTSAAVFAPAVRDCMVKRWL